MPADECFRSVISSLKNGPQKLMNPLPLLYKISPPTNIETLPNIFSNFQLTLYHKSLYTPKKYGSFISFSVNSLGGNIFEVFHGQRSVFPKKSYSYSSNIYTSDRYLKLHLVSYQNIPVALKIKTKMCNRRSAILKVISHICRIAKTQN